MSDNKPEPVVEECDRAAVRSCHALIARESWERTAEAFAAHRTAAVARREAEIVDILWTLGMNAAAMADMCDDDGASYASEVIKEAIKKIQNGGGA